MLNKVQLIGRLGKDPEVRNLDSGASLASFSLATSETYKNKDGEKKEDTQWHNIVLWRGLADVAGKYLHKGDLIFVEGKIRTRSWENDGQTKYITEIVGSEMKMLGGGKKEERKESQDSAPPPPSEEDDLPF